MTDGSVNTRRYDSGGRRRAAEARRRAVLDTAVAMVGERGYAATTMAGIAAAAGVSVEYLYKTFGDKPRLVRQLLDFVLAGDDAPVPVADRAEVQRMIAEPDPRVVLALYAARCAEVNGRAAGLLSAMSAGAPGDPQLAEVVATAEAQRLAAATALTADLAGKASLRVSATDARDVLWTLTAPEIWDLTVRRRGWSPERYASWLTTVWSADLLGPV